MAATDTTQMMPVRQEAIDAAAAKIVAGEEAVRRAEEWAEQVVVTNAAEVEQATQILRTLGADLKQVKAERTELTKPLNDYLKGVRDKFKALEAPIEAAAKAIKPKIIAFNEEAEQRRREEQERLDEERREAERIIEERRAKEAADLQAEAEAKRKEAEEAVELAEEDDELEELADEARAEARAAEARAATIANLPASNLPARPAPPAPKLNGAATTRRWDFEITDLRAVPDYLPDDTQLKEVLSGALRRYMNEHVKEHDAPPEIPGVKFERKSGLAVRS